MKLYAHKHSDQHVFRFEWPQMAARQYKDAFPLRIFQCTDVGLWIPDAWTSGGVRSAESGGYWYPPEKEEIPPSFFRSSSSLVWLEVPRSPRRFPWGFVSDSPAPLLLPLAFLPLEEGGGEGCFTPFLSLRL